LERKSGEKIEVRLNRSGESVAASFTLGTQSENAKRALQPFWETLGVELKTIPQEEFQATHQTRYRGGLMVTAVRAGGPAANQGIRRGDVLVGMHIWETLTEENVSYILNRSDFASLNPMKFFILRGDETLYGYLPLGTLKTAQR
ncbi:MAG: trypsin-like peptidase domain-containing protein, partial [Thermoguttaceae bacterium]